MRPNGSTKRHRRGFRRWVPGSDVVPVASSCRATGMNENVAPACGKTPFRARAICRRLKLNFRPAESRCGWRVRKTRDFPRRVGSLGLGPNLAAVGPETPACFRACRGRSTRQKNGGPLKDRCFPFGSAQRSARGPWSGGECFLRIGSRVPGAALLGVKEAERTLGDGLGKR